MAKKNIPNFSNRNKLIEMEKQKILRKKCDEVLPNVYACFAITLMQEEYGFSKQDIADLFSKTGAVWNACANKKISMREWVIELCGIDVVNLATNKVSDEYKVQEVEVWDCEGGENE